MTDGQFSKAGFVRTYALPVLFVMLIPAVGWWFANHAIGRYDTRVRESALTSLQTDTSLSAEEREQARAFYASVAASTVCRGGTPELDAMAPAFGTLCSEYTQFFWMRHIGIACIAIGILAFLFASGCVLTSLISQGTLYASFLAGWNVLKVASLLQAIGQGILAVLLSYWGTVVWFESYYPKLIVVAALAAAAAVFLIIKAIFKRIDLAPRVDGMLLTEGMAPRFWAHVRDMCRTLGTMPPTQIVVGVDDNFFVTETPIVIGDNRVEGRSLFVSFSLLKFMEKEEADAVLAHEMAHFSGDDTLYTKKMSPLLARYSEYLGALYAGGLSRPIFHFMLFFWGLFQLSINRMSRQREFRADQIAANATSPAHMGRALLKVVAYTSYRARIEEALFSENARQENLGIAARVSAGFASYVASPHLLGDVGARLFPHPFDSHPPLTARLAAIKASIIPSHYPRLLVQPVVASWLTDIDDAEGIEQEDVAGIRGALRRSARTGAGLPLPPRERRGAGGRREVFPGADVCDDEDGRDARDQLRARALLRVGIARRLRGNRVVRGAGVVRAEVPQPQSGKELEEGGGQAGPLPERQRRGGLLSELLLASPRRAATSRTTGRAGEEIGVGCGIIESGFLNR